MLTPDDIKKGAALASKHAGERAELAGRHANEREELSQRQHGEAVAAGLIPPDAVVSAPPPKKGKK